MPERDEHVVGSTTASMNQPPIAGQAGPSRPPEGAQVPGLFTAEQVAQICTDSSHSDPSAVAAYTAT